MRFLLCRLYHENDVRCKLSCLLFLISRHYNSLCSLVSRTRNLCSAFLGTADSQTFASGICILVFPSLECQPAVFGALVSTSLKNVSGFFPLIRTTLKQAMTAKSFSLKSPSETLLLETVCSNGFISNKLPLCILRSSWATFSDDLGDASMPLFQGVVLETASVLLHMNFTANLSSTNRLLFPCVFMPSTAPSILVTAFSDSTHTYSAISRHSERTHR